MLSYGNLKNMNMTNLKPIIPIQQGENIDLENVKFPRLISQKK